MILPIGYKCFSKPLFYSLLIYRHITERNYWVFLKKISKKLRISPELGFIVFAGLFATKRDLYIICLSFSVAVR